MTGDRFDRVAIASIAGVARSLPGIRSCVLGQLVQSSLAASPPRLTPSRYGCGNGDPVETTERFPQGSWKARTERDLSTFPQPRIFYGGKNKIKKSRTNAEAGRDRGWTTDRRLGHAERG